MAERDLYPHKPTLAFEMYSEPLQGRTCISLTSYTIAGLEEYPHKFGMKGTKLRERKNYFEGTCSETCYQAVLHESNPYGNPIGEVLLLSLI